MAEFIERALFTLDCSAGQFLLEGVSEFSVDAPHNLTAVKTMNRLGTVRGHRSGPKEVTGKMTIPTTLVAEAPLFEVWRTKERCLGSWEEGPGDGQRFQLPGFMIDNIARSYNVDGDATLEVSFVAEDMIQTA